jgi:hypothetical protein
MNKSFFGSTKLAPDLIPAKLICNVRSVICDYLNALEKGRKQGFTIPMDRHIFPSLRRNLNTDLPFIDEKFTHAQFFTLILGA